MGPLVKAWTLMNGFRFVPYLDGDVAGAAASALAFCGRSGDVRSFRLAHALTGSPRKLVRLQRDSHYRAPEITPDTGCGSVSAMALLRLAAGIRGWGGIAVLMAYVLIPSSYAARLKL